MDSARGLRPRVVAAVTFLAVVIFATGFAAGRRSRRDSSELAVVAEAHEHIRDLALRPPSRQKVSREAIEGILEALDDPFAEYLPPKAGRPGPNEIERRALGVEAQALRDAAGVSGRILDSGAGYVRLKLFSPGSGALVRTEVARLKRLGAKGLVLDLRGNPGGLVREALEVAGIFVGGRAVFRYETAGGGTGERLGRGEAVRDLALVVLTDRRSASAAELVAGAVQDHGRGLAVGQRTRGKASVQKVIELSDGSAVKFTSAVYRTPKGRRVSGVGITPDVTVRDGPGDPQLARAESLLRETAGT